MIYLVRARPDGKGSGVLATEHDGRLAALEAALDLRRQGMANILIVDASGREYSLPEFEKYCAETDE